MHFFLLSCYLFYDLLLLFYRFVLHLLLFAPWTLIADILYNYLTVLTPFNPLLRPTCVPGNPYYDSLGSMGVGTLLASVSAFLIYTNTEALLGRSIQAERVQKLTEFLESDPAVRSVNQSTSDKSTLALFPWTMLIGLVFYLAAFQMNLYSFQL